VNYKLLGLRILRTVHTPLDPRSSRLAG